MFFGGTFVNVFWRSMYFSPDQNIHRKCIEKIDAHRYWKSGTKRGILMEEDMETGGSRPGTGEGFSICGSENIFDCSSTTLIANLRSDFCHRMRRKFEQKLKADDQRLIWIGDKVWFAGCFLVVGGLSTVIKLSSWIWLVSNLTFVLEWGEIVNRSLKLTTNSYSEFETKFVWLVVDSTTILQFD